MRKAHSVSRRGEELVKEKVKIGISACLLGDRVRYDGGHKRDHYLADTLGGYVQWVPVCPEVEYGLPVPREAMRLVGDTAPGITPSLGDWWRKRNNLSDEKFFLNISRN